MPRIEVMSIDTDNDIIEIGPLRFFAHLPVGGHVDVEVRGLPRGSGPLLGRLKMTTDEWQGFEDAAVRLWRLTPGSSRVGGVSDG